MKIKNLLKCLLLCSLILLNLLAYQGFTQSVRRQSISSYATVASAETAISGQTAGQCYSTVSYSDKQTSVLSGFQQPVIFKVEDTAPLRLKTDFILFPNPANYRLTITSLSNAELSFVVVTDIKGKIIFQEELAYLPTHTINCASWVNGIYFVTVADVLQNHKTMKLIISK
jgi:hypothetical protein